MYGDDAQMATNYPLVRIKNNSSGHVFYCKTHNHSAMGVATGSAAVSTQFDIPSTVETGASTLVVVANGIPSAAVNVSVQGNFSLSATPVSQSVAQGTGTSYTVDAIAEGGFTGTIALTVSGLPAGAGGVFQPSSISNGTGSSTLSITTSSSTPTGTYTLTIKGTSGILVNTRTVTLVVVSSGAAWTWNLGGLASCDPSGQESYDFYGQQTAANSLQWWFVVSPSDTSYGQYSWTLYDSSGTFASGSYCGTEYCNPATGNSGTSITATRLPVGAPSFKVNGEFTIFGGCSTYYGGSTQMY